MSRPVVKFSEIFRILVDCQVEFLLVGGVAAVLEGVPLSTFDVDIVHKRSPENIDKLMHALHSIDAHYRDLTGRKLPPNPDLLVGDGHHLFMTQLGPLDVLGTIGKGRAFEELIANTVAYSLSAGTVRVLDLPTQISVKRETGRDKDLLALGLLQRTLEQKTK